MENFWLFRKFELRGSSVELQEEKIIGEVLTPEVDSLSNFPGRRAHGKAPKRLNTTPIAQHESRVKGPVSRLSFRLFNLQVINEEHRPTMQLVCFKRDCNDTCNGGK